MKLPIEFQQRMENLLGQREYKDFIDSYQLPRYYGLRVNTIKISVEEFLKISPFQLEPVKWTRDGFYYNEGERPAKHPYYHAGLYYIQEPSAMLPGAISGVKPGDRVLDLCAAPGGKSVQVAAALKGLGVLVSNDINATRAKALVKNIELCGIRNAVVTNETPQGLSKAFVGFFDKILIDAPCSGEGTFRKDQDSIKSWATYSVSECVAKQRDILKYAREMLRPGGEIIYSTCTFAPEENEGTMEEFLSNNPQFTVQEQQPVEGLSRGRPEWIGAREQLKNAIRIWPHIGKGEGHFVAKLKDTTNPGQTNTQQWEGMEAPIEFKEFVKDNLNIELEGNYIMYGQLLYLQPKGLPSLDGLKVMRPGWYLGDVKKNRFEPSHAMVLALDKTSFKRYLDIPSNSKEVINYLKGQTLEVDCPKGWTAIGTEGYSLGWGKAAEGILKNHYPKGWMWAD